MDNNYVIYNGELYHWGVKGMRWGVRRAQKRTNRIDRKAKKKSWSDDATEVAKIKTKKVSQMSNAELRRLNERNQLEVTNRDLKRKQSKGQRATQSFIKTAGTIAAVAGAAAIYKQHGEKILNVIGNKVLPAVGNMIPNRYV